MSMNPHRGSAWPRLRTYIVALATAAAVLAPARSEAAIAVTISWDRNPDSSTTGYYVLYGTQSRNYTSSVNVGNTTTAVLYLPDPTVTYYFAVQAYSATGERSQPSPETVWTPGQAPTLRNPGNMTGVVGVTITFQLSASDPRNLVLTYSVGGLPPGLSIASTTGQISGTPATAGTYNVTIAVTNSSGVSATQLFTWTIVGPMAGGGNTGGGGITSPPPTSGGTPGGGGTIGTPPPSSGAPGAGSTIGTPPSTGGTNPGGGTIGTPPPTTGGGSNPGTGNPGSGTTNPGGGSNTGPIPTAPDVTAPTLRVVSPSVTDNIYRTTNAKIIVTGTASDNVAVASILWWNDRGSAGTALGTSSWNTTPIDLKMGDNVITIIATDDAGNVRTATFIVTRFVDIRNYAN